MMEPMLPAAEEAEAAEAAAVVEVVEEVEVLMVVIVVIGDMLIIHTGLEIRVSVSSSSTKGSSFSEGTW